MHELSIACSIIEMIEENLPSENVKVVSVNLNIGRMSGVVPDALMFGFEVAAQDTRVAGANLLITDVPATLFCDLCLKETEIGDPLLLLCGNCGKPSGRIVRGKEMELVSIEFEDAGTEDN